jgi:ParB-like chromosome segregation protein Spo0J
MNMIDKMKTKTLPISSLRLEFQPQEHLLGERVQEYASAMRDGEVFPPVTVYYDGEKYWLFDGFHRVAAAKQVGIKLVQVEIVLGTFSDMERAFREFLTALKANLTKDKQP